jgi:hypothetical protein
MICLSLSLIIFLSNILKELIRRKESVNIARLEHLPGRPVTVQGSSRCCPNAAINFENCEFMTPAQGTSTGIKSPKRECVKAGNEKEKKSWSPSRNASNPVSGFRCFIREHGDRTTKPLNALLSYNFVFVRQIDAFFREYGITDVVQLLCLYLLPRIDIRWN